MIGSLKVPKGTFSNTPSPVDEIVTALPYSLTPVASVITTLPPVIGVPPDAPVSLKLSVSVPTAETVNAPLPSLRETV